MERKITDEIYKIGVYDDKLDLFEGHYQIPNGVTYNSYLIKGEKNIILPLLKNFNNISENNITIKSNLSADNLQEIKNLAYEIKNQLNWFILSILFVSHKSIIT